MKKGLLLGLFLSVFIANSQIRTDILALTDSITEVYEKIPSHYISEENSKELNLLQRLRQEFRSKIKDNELIYIYKNNFKSKVKNEVLNEIYIRKDIDKVKLFKETVQLKDELEGFSKEEIYLIQGLFFDYLTDNNDSNLTNDLVDYIFKSEPLNVSLIESIAYKIPKRQEYYNKVRKLTIQYQSKYLLNYILEFKNENDIELIKNFQPK